MTMNYEHIQDLFKRKYIGKNINLCRDKMENFVEVSLKLLFPAMCNQSAQDSAKLKENFEYLYGELNTILTCIRG